MPQTIIKIKTWGCECGYHQDFEPTAELMTKHFGRSGVLCPSCKKADLGKETNLDKKITMTVMGEEDIETEIEQIKDRKIKGEGKNDPDVSTSVKENVYREKRKQDIAEAILKAKENQD